jgi:hypothetical protein
MNRQIAGRVESGADHIAEAGDQKNDLALLFENGKGSKDPCLIAALSA